MAPEWVLSIPGGLCLLLLAVTLRLRVGSWLAPGPFFALIWFVFAGAPLLMAPDYLVAPAAVLWIVAFAGSVVMGAEIGSSLGGAIAPRSNFHSRDVSSLIPIPTVRRWTWVYFFLGMISTLIFVRALGVSWASLLGFEGWVALGRQVAVGRYQEGLVAPVLSRVLLTGIYAGGLLGGTLAGLSAHSEKRGVAWTAAVPLVPALFSSLVTTAKAPLLFTLILWVAAFLSTRVWFSGSSAALFTRRLVLVSLAALGSIVGFFGLLNLIRYGWVGEGRTLDAFLRMRIYAFGHVGAFSHWYMSGDVSLLPRSIGDLTFAGPLSLLGLANRVQGLIPEMVEIGSGAYTNVYTFFRGLIEDFGLLGALAVLFGVGVVAGISHRMTLGGGWLAKAGLTTLALFYSLTLWGFVASILAYNSLVLAFVAFFGHISVGALPRIRLGQKLARPSHGVIH